MKCRIDSGLDAPMVAVDRFVSADLRILEAIGLLLCREKLDVLTKSALVAFECENLVGLLRHLDLAKHQSLARRERRNHVDRLLRTLLRSARRLAVDGDHIGWHTGQRRHPRYEASLELLGVERRQNVAEVVVGRRSVA